MQSQPNFIYLSGYRIQPADHHTQEEFNSIVQDKQILGILGYPVKRRIVDQADHVILNIGDLITIKAVIQAKQAGHLETLVNAVYRLK